MSAVTISIPSTLEDRIKQAIQKKGFASKAELFRFAIIRYLDVYEEMQESQVDKAILEGLSDYKNGRVIGPFRTVSEFKAIRDSKIKDNI
jgi:metal-responsive CopG/Arc/MetJ family transcriptional regulator